MRMTSVERNRLFRFQAFNPEVVAFCQFFAAICQGGRGSGVLMRRKVSYLRAMLQVQLARPAVIVQAVSDVGVLLDLANSQPRPNCVNCSGGNENSVAGRYGAPI